MSNIIKGWWIPWAVIGSVIVSIIALAGFMLGVWVGG